MSIYSNAQATDEAARRVGQFDARQTNLTPVQAALLARAVGRYPEVPAGIQVAAVQIPANQEQILEAANVRAQTNVERKPKPGGIGGFLSRGLGAVKNVAAPVANAVSDAADFVTPEGVEDVIGTGLQGAQAFAKPGARAGFTVAESGLQAVVGAGRAVYGSATGQYDAASPLDFVQDIWKQTTAGQVMEDWAAGRDVELGTGFFPQQARYDAQGAPTNTVARRAQFERSVATVGNSAWTPGRWVATDVFALQPGSGAYNIASGLVDVTVAIGADPANLLLGGLSKAGRARSLGSTIVGKKAVARAASKADPLWRATVEEGLGLIPGIYKSPRESVLVSQASKWLYGDVGRDVVVKLTEMGSATEIWRASGKRFPLALSQLIAGADDPAAVVNLLASRLTDDVRFLPTRSAVTGQIGSISDRVVRSRQAQGRLWNLTPDLRIGWEDPESAFRNVDNALANMNTHGVERDLILDEWAAALTAPTGKKQARYEATRLFERTLELQLADNGFDPELAKEMSRFTRRMNEVNAYGMDEFAHGIEFAAGEGAGPLMTAQLINTGFYLYDPASIRKVRESTMNNRVLKFMANNPGWRGSTTFLAAIQTEIWKPATLIKGSYLSKILPEEFLRAQFGGGFESALDHIRTMFDRRTRKLNVFGDELVPASQKAQKLVDERDVLREGLEGADEADVASRLVEIEVELAQLNDEIIRRVDTHSAAMNRHQPNQLFNESGAERQVAQQVRMGNMQTVNKTQNPAEWRRGNAEALLQMASDPVAKRVAAGGLFDGDRVGGRSVFDLVRYSGDSVDWIAGQPAGAYFWPRKEGVTNEWESLFGRQSIRGEHYAPAYLTEMKASPRKPLIVPKSASDVSEEVSAGEMALRRLAGDSAVDDLAALIRADDQAGILGWAAERGIDIPTEYLDEEGFYGIVDSMGGILARNRGYDSIVSEAVDAPGWSEFVMLASPDQMVGDAAAGARPGVDGVVDWLNFGAGKKFRDEMAEVYPDYPPEDVAQRMVDVLVQNLRYRTGDDPRLLEAVARGQLDGRAVGEASAVKGSKPTKALLDVLEDVRVNNPNVSEFTMHRPSLVERQGGGRDMNKFIEHRDRLVSWFFQDIYGRGSDYLNRSPVYRTAYWTRAEELAPHMAPKEAAKLAATAAKTLPKKQAQRIADAAGRAAGDLKRADVDSLAGAAALDDTRKLLFDATKRTQLFDVLRVVSPFGEAWREILTSYSRILKAQPRVLRRFQQTVNAARSAGWFYTDENGQEQYRIHGSGALMDVFTGGALETDLSIGLESLSMGTQVIPAVGPSVGFVASQFIPDVPATDWLRRTMFPYGEPERMDLLPVPPWLDKIWQGAGWVDGQTAASTKRHVMDALAIKNNYPNTREGQARLLADADRVANGVLVARGIAQFISPAAPLVRYTAETPQGDVLAVKLGDEFRKLQEEPGVSYDDAVIEFLGKYGIGAALYLVPGTKATVPGLESTPEFGAFERENRWLFAEHPEVAGYFGPRGEGSDYAVFLRQKQAGLREDLSPNERLAMANQLVGDMVVDQQIAEMPPRKDWGDAERAYVRDLKAQVEQEYPGYTAFVAFDVNEQKRRIEDLVEAAADPRIADTPIAGAILEYAERRDEAQKIAADRGRASFDSSEDTADLREWLTSVGAQLADQTPGFATVWDRLLAREVEPDGA